MLKECTKCHNVFLMNSDNFHRHKASKDGFYPQCKICKNSYSRTSKGIEVRKNKIEKRDNKYPEKKQAKYVVKYAVKIGKLPKVKTLNCEVCHKQAQEYHHWSYSLENILDVIPLCKRCHVDIHNGLITYPLSREIDRLIA